MTEYYGGLWKDTKREGCERHHPWAWDTLYWLTSVGLNESPVVQMIEKEHHNGTYSFGGDFNSQPGQFRQWQAEEFIRDNFWTAWEVDKQRIRSLFGTKYDKAFEQAEVQARKLEAEGKLKVDAEKLKLYRERQELEKQEKLADEKLKEANAKKYQSEIEKQREVEKAKAEQDRIEAQKELNKAKLDERHQQLQKEIAEKQLAEAKEKSQAEEIKRHEQAVQKETANLKEAESARKEAEARAQGKVEEYAKQKEAEQQQRVRDLEERVKQLETEAKQREVQFAKQQSELHDRLTQIEQRDQALIEAVRAKEQTFQARQDLAAAMTQQSSSSSNGEHRLDREQETPEVSLNNPSFNPQRVPVPEHWRNPSVRGENEQFDPIKHAVTSLEQGVTQHRQRQSKIFRHAEQNLEQTRTLQEKQRDEASGHSVKHRQIDWEFER